MDPRERKFGHPQRCLKPLQSEQLPPKQALGPNLAATDRSSLQVNVEDVPMQVVGSPHTEVLLGWGPCPLRFVRAGGPVA